MSNPIVIVTGGARGIGFGIGSCFARSGASIVVADVDQGIAQDAAAKLNAAGAVNSIGMSCDVTQRSDVDAMIQRTLATYGRIDVLVNNAGICPFIDVMSLTPEAWARTIDVNLNGAFHCTQLVAREMIATQRGGRIIFITSLAENLTSPNQVDYGASKAGMRMLMVGFAAALGPHGITCNAVAPGIMLTPMTEHHWSQPGPAQEIKARVPVGRIGQPEDIGEAVLFLASRQADYISGITLRVDGGFSVVCK